MHSLLRERYLKDLPKTLYRLLNVYSELKKILENINEEHEKGDYLLELEQQLKEIKTEIARINYTLQIIKTK